MKALILVGGYGTRLRPLTFNRPKPLVPFVNKPILLHQIEALVAAGVRDITLAVSYLPTAISEFMADVSKRLGICIRSSVETEPLGTAGPLALAESYLSGQDPFFVLNSDVICSFPLVEMLHYHRNHGGEGTIMVTQVEDPSKYGVVVSEDGKCIDRFVEKPTTFVSNKINAGIYMFNPSILRRIAPRKMSIEREVFPGMASDRQLFQFVLPGFWMDVGQPKDFLKGQGLFLDYLRQTQSGLLVSRPLVVDNVIIHSTADVDETAKIGPNVVIGPNAVIEAGVRLRDTAIFGNARVRQSAFLQGCLIGCHSSVGSWSRLQGVILGDDVTVKEELSLSHLRVAPHKTIKESMHPDASAPRDIM